MRQNWPKFFLIISRAGKRGENEITYSHVHQNRQTFRFHKLTCLKISLIFTLLLLYIKHIKVFGVLPLQRHPSPLSGSIWFFIVFSILSLIFFLITVFTNIFFLSCHCFTYIFLFTVLLELIFFTFQHSLGYF